MKMNVIAAVSATCVMCASVATAAPAVAAKGEGAAAGDGATSTWVMPDVKGMILHPALKSILSATGGKQVKIRYIDAGHLPVYNDEKLDGLRAVAGGGGRDGQVLGRPEGRAPGVRRVPVAGFQI
ncbi:MAG: hypothetical protein SW019_24050 [Actinomycetota bacterium]|nr:hypothetical protein [Actinomycetota bacterium]